MVRRDAGGERSYRSSRVKALVGPAAYLLALGRSSVRGQRSPFAVSIRGRWLAARERAQREDGYERSEERRVGKERRCRWAPHRYRNKSDTRGRSAGSGSAQPRSCITV